MGTNFYTELTNLFKFRKEKLSKSRAYYETRLIPTSKKRKKNMEIKEAKYFDAE